MRHHDAKHMGFENQHGSSTVAKSTQVVFGERSVAANYCT